MQPRTERQAAASRANARLATDARRAREAARRDATAEAVAASYGPIAEAIDRAAKAMALEPPAREACARHLRAALFALAGVAAGSHFDGARHRALKAAIDSIRRTLW